MLAEGEMIRAALLWMQLAINPPMLDTAVIDACVDGVPFGGLISRVEDPTGTHGGCIVWYRCAPFYKNCGP
jgi:hypothetical protein